MTGILIHQTWRAAALLGLVLTTAAAQAAPHGGGQRQQVNRTNQNLQVRHGSSSNINHNINYNHNTNVNVNRNVNVNVHGGYGYGYGSNWDNNYHPVAIATAAAITTAVVIGAVSHSIPPSCVNVVVGGSAYYQCGSTWYRPQYAGSSITYIAVNQP